MQLTVLVDNNTFMDRYYLAEPGLSVFIEAEGKKVLFDLGYSDVFMINANKKGIHFYDLDTVAISHSHLDHTWGFDALIKMFTEMRFEQRPYKKPQLIAHPEAFISRTFDGGDEFGIMTRKDVLARYFDLVTRKEPLWLTENLVYLGEIPRENDFEARTPIGKIETSAGWQDDYMLDDTALAYRSSEGLVVITGCSHAGICNIVERAKEVCGERRVLDVIGGFHLQQPSAAQLNGTLQYFADLKPAVLHACHCTDLASKIALSQVAAIKEVGAGMVLKYADILK